MDVFTGSILWTLDDDLPTLPKPYMSAAALCKPIEIHSRSLMFRIWVRLSDLQRIFKDLIPKKVPLPQTADQALILQCMNKVFILSQFLIGNLDISSHFLLLTSRGVLCNLPKNYATQLNPPSERITETRLHQTVQAGPL